VQARRDRLVCRADRASGASRIAFMQDRASEAIPFGAILR
jgi:hypothetical protein